MKSINVGVIGTGWCGGIRANTCATNPLVENLHLAEINPEKLGEIAGETLPESATTDYQELLKNDEIDGAIISTTPEQTHFPMARESLNVHKHVFWKSHYRSR